MMCGKAEVYRCYTSEPVRIDPYDNRIQKLYTGKLHIFVCAYASEKMCEREVSRHNQIMINDTRNKKNPGVQAACPVALHRLPAGKSLSVWFHRISGDFAP